MAEPLTVDTANITVDSTDFTADQTLYADDQLPVGPILSSLDTAKSMLRDCYWWRRILSEDSPWDDATAAAHIHFDELPAPTPGPNHSRSQLNALRPFAILWHDLAGGLRLRSDTGGNCCAVITGRVIVRLELGVPANIASDTDAVARWFMRAVGRILKSNDPNKPGLWELSGRAGYLPITEIDVSGYVRTDSKERRELGDAIQIELQIDWGGG